jgi:hypothetical protein
MVYTYLFSIVGLSGVSEALKDLLNMSSGDLRDLLNISSGDLRDLLNMSW